MNKLGEEGYIKVNRHPHTVCGLVKKGTVAVDQ